jgi:hypothetical protein
MEYNIKLSEGSMQVVMDALGELPWVRVNEAIASIINQVREQQDAAKTASAQPQDGGD